MSLPAERWGTWSTSRPVRVPGAVTLMEQSTLAMHPPATGGAWRGDLRWVNDPWLGDDPLPGDGRVDEAARRWRRAISAGVAVALVLGVAAVLALLEGERYQIPRDQAKGMERPALAACCDSPRTSSSLAQHQSVVSG